MEANSTHTVSTRDIIHAGFQEIGRAKERLNALGEQTGGRVEPPALLARLAHSIDPDTALANLADIIQVMPGEPLTSILDDAPCAAHTANNSPRSWRRTWWPMTPSTSNPRSAVNCPT